MQLVHTYPSSPILFYRKLIQMGTSKLVIVFCFLHLAFSSTTTGVLAAFRRESFSYNDGFDKGRDEKFFEFLGDHATIYSEALQLTPETLNDQFIDIHYNKSGRILYHKPFRLWLSSDNNEDEVLASFTSTFVINIYREATWKAGHGLAFLIAPDLSIPEDSYGQWLGLTNATTDGNPTNRIIAIEFDTEKQDPFDPDDNHIGLNINSVKSNKTISLDDYNITISPEEGTNYMVWVQYDGLSKRLEVYMAKDGEPKPQQPLLNETINLKDYVKQESYFGFAASTGKPQIELNCVLKWSLEIDSLPNEKDLTWLKISVGVGAPLIMIVLVLCAAAVYVNHKRRARLQVVEKSEFGKLRWLPGMPREFRYKALKKATNNFHISMKLGEGGFGVVYRGLLHEREPHSHNENSQNTTEIAVKKFSRDNINGKDDFLAELTIIHRLRHKHLVRLLGWCYEKRKLLLVYDFMPNGSLEKHLYEASGQTTLNWSHRNKILIGLASALHYLHEECDQKVVHRDLKASNILLDEDFNARLGDFGLARELEKDRNSYAELDLGGVPGTIGYVAPECFHTGKATPESDVFGFGAVVLEVVGGRNPGAKVHHDQHLYSLVDWVWMLHRERRIDEAVDARLQNDFDINEAERLLLLGLACSHPIHSERPTTRDIVQIISGTMPPPRVPPFKPVFTWPSIDMATATSITDDSLSSITLSASYSLRIQRLNSSPRASSHLPV